MRRIGIVGLCLVAMFALSAIVAGAAQAALPEFQICGKAKVKDKGPFGLNCLGGPKQGDFELLPWQGKDTTERKLSGKSGITFLTGYVKPLLLAEPGKGLIDFVTCTKGSATGEITGAKTDQLTFTWSKCSVEKGTVPCQSGVKAGEIKRSLLEGELGYETAGLPVMMNYGAKNRLEPFVTFNCGGAPVEFYGDALALPSFINMPLKTNPETFTVLPGGEQREMTFENAPLAREPVGFQAPFEEFNWGIETKTTLTDDKALEIVA